MSMTPSDHPSQLSPTSTPPFSLSTPAKPSASRLQTPRPYQLSLPLRRHDHAPSPRIPYADGTPQMRLLGAATVGDLALLERMAKQLDGGRGRLAEAVDAVKDQGVGALHLAAAAKKLEVCEFLVEDIRVDVDAFDKCGRTPLVWAIGCKGAQVDIVRYLLDHGANPNNVDKIGFTPLHEATKLGLCEVVELLLSGGAYVNPFSSNHGTPLHLAAKYKQDGAMKILLDHHADAGADVKGIHTTTPLLAAATTGLTDVLKPLLDAGADPNVPNEYGQLPIILAAYFGTRKDLEILFEATSSRIPAVHDWSVDGIISHIKSERKLEDYPLSKMSVAKLKEEGGKAMHKEDYYSAIEFYNMALVVDPKNVDATLIGNRGFCRLLLGNGEGALNDAHLLRTMQPDSADSYWLQGYSYVQLKEYEKACDAFLDGLKLKPGFVGIEGAKVAEALRLLKESHADKKKGIGRVCFS
ncbi:unnamed protein product [Alopecurus aequalis]